MSEPVLDLTFPLADLVPADYNPRKITDEAFLALQASLRDVGFVKPVILNQDLTLVAGHQRTKAAKAIGMTTVPAIKLGRQVNRADEIRFNLAHNMSETAQATASIRSTHPAGWSYIQPEDIAVEEGTASGPGVAINGALISKYGGYGSVLLDPAGRIVANTEYLAAGALAKVPVLAYKLNREQAEAWAIADGWDYGTYAFENLGIKPYVQVHCQLPRKPGGKISARPKRSNDQMRYGRSRLYEELTRSHFGTRALDFGAGRCIYAKKAVADGWPVFPYEPHLRFDNENRYDIEGIIRQLAAIYHDVRRNGLYPLVILDSVLNSVTSNEFEHAVLTTCNAFTAPDGELQLATRRLRENDPSKMTAGALAVEYLDADRFSVKYRKGTWTMQHFHTPDTLHDVLTPYYENIEIIPSSSTMRAICTGPIPQPAEKLRAALDLELNLELPGGRHSRHGELRDLVLRLHGTHPKP